MSKGKLERFAENERFDNMFQSTYKDLEKEGDFPLKGKWAKEFFKNDNPIVLELGCGKGEYTIGLGEKYIDKNFIGVDIKGARMWRGCKTSNINGMKNIAFLRTQIELIDNYFANDEVDEIWITFPDPQLNKERKRLSSERFLERYRRIMKKGGIIHLKTDSQELYSYTMDEVLRPNNMNILFHSADLYNSNFNEDVIGIRTFYENIYLSQSKPITYIKFEI